MFVRWQNGLCSRRVHRQNVKHQLNKQRSSRDYWYLGEFWDTRAARWNAEKQKSLCERISEEMAARGFLRTFKQCRNKIKWLKHKYKRVVDRILSAVIRYVEALWVCVVHLNQLTTIVFMSFFISIFIFTVRETDIWPEINFYYYYIIIINCNVDRVLQIHYSVDCLL